MKLLALPGKSKTTFHWFCTLLKALGIGETTREIQTYECWLKPGEEIDLALEASKARAYKSNIVIAKSLGTVVASKAFSENTDNIKFVFIGTPINIFLPEWKVELIDLIKKSDVLFIQQCSDKMGTVNELRSALPKECELFGVPGKDHLYNDADRISSAIESWYESR